MTSIQKQLKLTFDFDSPVVVNSKDNYILQEEIGIVYKITNKIQYDPFHEKYKYLNPWDSCYIGCTSRAFDKRYQDGIENTHNPF